MPSNVSCFKSFFKHTWQPQQIVENSSKLELKDEYIGTELSVVKIEQPIGTASTAGGSSDDVCKNANCKNNSGLSIHSESPWHGLKTTFLVSIIVALIFWIVIYAVLAQKQII